MTAFLATIKEVFTWTLTCVGDVLTFIISKPALLIGLGISLVFGLVLFAKKLITR